MISDSQRSHIKKCKISLYIALLDVSVIDISDWDIELMYALATDPDIQAVLDSKKGDNKNNDNS